jgi:hypothetical protein
MDRQIYKMHRQMNRAMDVNDVFLDYDTIWTCRRTPEALKMETVCLKWWCLPTSPHNITTKNNINISTVVTTSSLKKTNRRSQETQ